MVIRSRSANTNTILRTNTNTILRTNTNTNAVTNKHRSDTFGCLVHGGGQSEKNPKLVDVKINAQKCKYLNRNTETQIQNVRPRGVRCDGMLVAQGPPAEIIRL